MKPASSPGHAFPLKITIGACKKCWILRDFFFSRPSLQPSPSLFSARRARAALHFWEAMDKKQGRCCNFQNTWWGRVKG